MKVAEGLGKLKYWWNNLEINNVFIANRWLKFLGSHKDNEKIGRNRFKVNFLFRVYLVGGNNCKRLVKSQLMKP